MLSSGRGDFEAFGLLGLKKKLGFWAESLSVENSGTPSCTGLYIDELLLLCTRPCSGPLSMNSEFSIRDSLLPSEISSLADILFRWVKSLLSSFSCF